MFRNNLRERIVEIWENYNTGVAIIAIIGIFLLSFGLTFGLMCFYSWLIMIMWNWAIVGLFGAPALSFWMAFVLRLLCCLLFKHTISVNTSKKDS